LLYAQDEVRIVKEQLQAASMHVLDSTAEHLRIEDVRSGLKDHQANILHLACHGVQAAQPLESCFVLADGKLTIGDLMKLDLPQATFAFLSACQTAKSNHNHADQTVHLAASMLFCGFRSVVGTLW
jgi:CHAT domain-containing protein